MLSVEGLVAATPGAVVDVADESVGDVVVVVEVAPPPSAVVVEVVVDPS